MGALIDQIERKYQTKNENRITDSNLLASLAERKRAGDAKTTKLVAWMSLVIGLIGAVAAVVALFK